MSDRIELVAGTPPDLAQAVAIDDDACTLYREAGIDLAFGADHPVVVAERTSWRAAAAAGRMVFARGADGVALGLVVYGWLDGDAYLEQVSVRRAAQRRGVGRALIEHVAAWAGAQGAAALWLATYGHLPFNRAYYERCGFSVVPPPHRPELAAVMALHQRWLPSPEERVAMRRAIAPPAR